MYRSFLDELVHMHYLELMALLPVLLILSGLCVKENFCRPEPTIWNTRSRTCFCVRPCWSGSRCIGTEPALHSRKTPFRGNDARQTGEGNVR